MRVITFPTRLKMLSLFSIRCVLLLTKKSVRVTLRQSSIRTLILLSTTLVLGFLYGMWYLSRGQYRYFLTANDFTKLSFDIKCSPDVELKPEASYLLPLVGNNRNSNSFVNVSNSGNSSDDFSVYVYNRDDLHNSDKDSYEDSYRNKDSSIDADLPSNSELGSSSAEAGDRNLKKKHRKHHKDQNQLGNHSDVHTGQKTGGNENNLHCKPFRDANTPQGWLSPTDLLFNIIRDGTLTDPDHQDTQQFTRLLTSMMMNGLPLLDIDDYIYLSDFINNYLGETTRKELLNYAIYRDKFGNFLNVRQNQLRIVPNEGMATDFVRYLNESSKLFNVSIIIYIAMLLITVVY